MRILNGIMSGTWRRLATHVLLIPLLAGLVAILTVALAAVLLYPKLPALDALTDYRPSIPLRVYTADSTLIGEFGQEHRAVVTLANVPRELKLAILAAEDARFYEHGAIDFNGVLRSAFANTLRGAARQGASTITMQLARNLYLSPDKTFYRKFAEVLLAYKIENELTKDEIFERYINQIYLGNRSYGFGAAAGVYFNKSLEDLSLAEAAVLAGLPKAPSRYNPHIDLKAAKLRSGYVLDRMRVLGYIDQAQYEAALAEPIQTVSARAHYAVDAPYVAEEVRRMMYEQYGEAVYSDGYSVYTTLRDRDQTAADVAVRTGVLAYDRRHRYRGAEGEVELGRNATANKILAEGALRRLSTVSGLEPAVVLRSTAATVEAIAHDGKLVQLTGDELKFGGARRKLRPGSIIRLERRAGHWLLAQLPQAEAALIALNPDDGAVLALCGGFDFYANQFDHATQAYRQPGSSFKPLVYSAALERGFSPSTIVDDLPLEIPPSYPGGPSWSPQNYEGGFLGPITVREALAKSRNVPTVRVLLAIGVPYAREYVSRFGLPLQQIPPYPSMVLGTGLFTPLQMAGAYAVFANGGYRTSPYLIQRVVDAGGKTIFEAEPARAGEYAPHVIDERNAFLMTSLLQDVVRRGTAARAQSLGRRDLAGKTGSTENAVDAWFAGYNRARVAVSWIGFDQTHSLGKGEVGAQAALPIWQDYMRVALKDVPDQSHPVPPGVVQAGIDDDSRSVAPGAWHDRVDYFYRENAPLPQVDLDSAPVR